MPTLTIESVVACPVETLWDFHQSAEALTLLTPAGRRVELLSEDAQVVLGALHQLRVRQFGLPVTWHARIVEVDPPHRFVDVAERSPFRSWRHEHAFLPHAEGSMLRDTVEYVLPLGPLGMIADTFFVRRDLERLFRFRHEVTRAQLANS